MKKSAKKPPASIDIKTAVRKFAKKPEPAPADAPDPKVNHPRHYLAGGVVYETFRVIEAWAIGSRSPTSGFNLGNAIKYLSRAGLKGDYLEDLKKARWYLNREIELAEALKAREEEYLKIQRKLERL